MPYSRSASERTIRYLTGWVLALLVVWMAIGEPLLCLIHCQKPVPAHQQSMAALATVQAATGRQILFRQPYDALCALEHVAQERAPQPVFSTTHDALLGVFAVWVVLIALAFAASRPVVRPRPAFHQRLVPPPIRIAVSCSRSLLRAPACL